MAKVIVSKIFDGQLVLTRVTSNVLERQTYSLNYRTRDCDDRIILTFELDSDQLAKMLTAMSVDVLCEMKRILESKND